MNIAAEMGLVNPDFCKVLESQIDSCILSQILFDYVAKRPELWMTFAILYAKQCKGGFLSYDDYFQNLRNNFNIDVSQVYMISDVLLIEKLLGLE